MTRFGLEEDETFEGAVDVLRMAQRHTRSISADKSMSRSFVDKSPRPIPHNISPRKHTWKSIIQKAHELENELETRLVLLDAQDAFKSIAVVSDQKVMAQTQSLEASIEQLRKKNEEMKQAVQKSIANVNKRQEEFLKKQKEAEAKKEAELKQKKEEETKKQQEQQEKAKKEEQETKQKEQEQQKKLEEQQKAQQAVLDAKKLAEAPGGQDPRYASPNAWKVYEEHVSKVKTIKEDMKKTMAENKTTMNFFFMKKMAITQRVGQLTNSLDKIKEIAVAINQVFSDAQGHSQSMYEWILSFAAKAVVKQAEREVAVKKDTAFPLAFVCVLLYGKHTSFLPILLGRLMKKCSYVAGIYIKKAPGQTDADYMKAVGYKKRDDKDFESEIQYGERMCGILAFYAALIQMQPSSNAHGMDNGWTWFARILNMKPRKITPLIIHTFLEIAGSEMLNTYQGQMKKMLLFLIQAYYPMIPEKATAARTRLQLFLEDTFLKSGRIPKYENSDLQP